MDRIPIVLGNKILVKPSFLLLNRCEVWIGIFFPLSFTATSSTSTHNLFARNNLQSLAFPTPSRRLTDNRLKPSLVRLKTHYSKRKRVRRYLLLSAKDAQPQSRMSHIALSNLAQPTTCMSCDIFPILRCRVSAVACTAPVRPPYSVCCVGVFLDNLKSCKYVPFRAVINNAFIHIILFHDDSLS